MINLVRRPVSVLIVAGGNRAWRSVAIALIAFVRISLVDALVGNRETHGL